MALELNKLTGQIDAMSTAMGRRRDQLQDTIRAARELLRSEPAVTETLRAKLELARQADPWRRSALPLGDRLDVRHRPAVELTNAVLVAADGSQIYPDRHGIATYYLINTGSIVFRHGSGQSPITDSRPEIFFEEDDLYDARGQVHTPEYVNRQRDRREIEALADLAEAERRGMGGDLSFPIIALADGPILPWLRPDPEDSDAINREIEFTARQLERLRRVRAIPIGYVDRPDSAYVLRILELLDMPGETITREALRKGRFLTLADRRLFADLEPNERTALFTPDSEGNERFHRISGGDRITITYANVSRRPGLSDSAIVRIEMPGWVAVDPAMLDMAQQAVYDNCEPVGYPYVLTRAHELAVVGPAERAALEQMLQQAMWRQGIVPEVSRKAGSKLLIAAG